MKHSLFLMSLVLLSACASQENGNFHNPLLVYTPSTIGSETIFYDPFAHHWRDNAGLCNTCTRDREFYSDGTVPYTENISIIWQGIQIALQHKNGTSPSEQEVADFLQQNYAEPSGFFPVLVRKDKTNFYLIIPRDNIAPAIDLTSENGILRSQYNIGNISQE